MGYFKVTSSTKKKRTDDEMKEHIYYNLKRLHDIDRYPLNKTTESGVLGMMNVSLCGIDRSGKCRQMAELDPRIKWLWAGEDDTFGIEECRRRNYLVVYSCLKNLVEKDDFTFHLPIDDFKLHCWEGLVVWDKDGGAERDWTTLNSVDIIFEMIKMIKKRKIIAKLRGPVDDDFENYTVPKWWNPK